MIRVTFAFLRPMLMSVSVNNFLVFFLSILDDMCYRMTSRFYGLGSCGTSACQNKVVWISKFWLVARGRPRTHNLTPTSAVSSNWDGVRGLSLFEKVKGGGGGGVPVTSLNPETFLVLSTRDRHSRTHRSFQRVMIPLSRPPFVR